MAGGARLVTGLGWCACWIWLGIYGETALETPGEQARGASDWLGAFCSATRFRGTDAQRAAGSSSGQDLGGGGGGERGGLGGGWGGGGVGAAGGLQRWIPADVARRINTTVHTHPHAHTHTRRADHRGRCAWMATLIAVHAGRRCWERTGESSQARPP